MSEKTFKEARNSLALSQSLLDKLRMQQPQETPQEPQNNPQPHEQEGMEETPMMEETMPHEPEMEQKGMLEAIKDTIKPMFDDIKEMFSKKEDEPQEVEIKIDGEMKPKEESKEE